MIGLCCQYIEKKVARTGKESFINIIDEKRLQYNQFLKGKYTTKHIEETWINNLLGLLSVLKRINAEGFKVFRISSGLLPLYDSVPELHNSQTAKDILNIIGKFILENKIRVTTHPDQFVVLSSDNPNVIKNSINMLLHHGWIFDQMNLPTIPYYAINIHGGKKGNTLTLIESIKKLPQSTKDRLTLENDERSYNVKDLLSVFQETGIPIVWDSHHHSFNNAELTPEEALNICKNTWRDIKPLTHLSNTSPDSVNGSFTERRKHSDYVHYIPECQLLNNNIDQIDIDFEFKMKNLAILKAVGDFKIKL